MIIDKQHICKIGADKAERITTQLLVIESGCLAHFDEYLDGMNLNGKLVAVYDTNTFNAKGIKHIHSDFDLILPAEGLHANEKAIAAIEEMLPKDAKIVVAVGSGTIHDVARYAAAKIGASFVSCPTAASVDGFCSSVCAMTINGAKKTVNAVAPVMVIADLDVIKNAPIRLAKSGMGDMLGKYVSVADWRIGHILTGEEFDENISNIVFKAVELVKQNAEGVLRGDELSYEYLTYGLLLSGITMQVVGSSRPASGAEHHISHLIETAPKYFCVKESALHGEKVGVGTLLIAEEYHNIAKIPQIDFLLHDPHLPSEKTMNDCFGESAASIIEENKNDCSAKLPKSRIAECWKKIRSTVAAIPQTAELDSLYSRIGLRRTLEDVGVDSKFRKELLLFSPFVRNRLTLERVISEFGLLD